MSSEMTPEMALAWRIYIARVQVVVNQQQVEYAQGVSAGIRLEPPNQEAIDLISKALGAAREEGVKLALGPVVRLCDAIDNSRSKALKAIRPEVEACYHALHRLREHAKSGKTGEM
jgi:hypothetical protein